jgi:hypothetical protein
MKYQKTHTYKSQKHYFFYIMYIQIHDIYFLCMQNLCGMVLNAIKQETLIIIKIEKSHVLRCYKR